jgi:hypothetical protein
MKTLVTILFICGCMSLQAQVPIEVKVETRPCSQGVQPSFEVMVPQTTANDAIDLWKKTIIPGGLFKKKPKSDKVNDEWIAFNVLIPEINVLPVNVYTQISEFTGTIYFRVFFQADKGFIGTQGSPEATVQAASGYVRNFAVELYREAVTKELKKEEKELKNLEDNLSKLERQNKNYNEKISDAQKEEKDLKNEDLMNKELLKNQQNVIQLDSNNQNSDKVKEELEKKNRDTEKDLSKSLKAQSKFTKKVSGNERDQQDKLLAIERQKIRVAEVRKKLDNIK